MAAGGDCRAGAPVWDWGSHGTLSFACQKTKYSLNVEALEPPRSWGRQRRLEQLLRGVWMLAEQWGGCCGVTVSMLTLLFSRGRDVEGLSNHGLSVLHLFSSCHKGRSLQEQLIWILVWGYGTVSVTQCVLPGENTHACSSASGFLCLFLWGTSSLHIYLCSFLTLQPTSCDLSLPKPFSQ